MSPDLARALERLSERVKWLQRGMQKPSAISPGLSVIEDTLVSNVEFALNELEAMLGVKDAVDR